MGVKNQGHGPAICPKCKHVSHWNRKGDKPCRVVGCECDHKFGGVRP